VWDIMPRSKKDKATGVNQVDNKGMTALHFAASGGHAEVIKVLLASGADVNMPHCTSFHSYVHEEIKETVDDHDHYHAF
jgi:ankyrin repeat protein